MPSIDAIIKMINSNNDNVITKKEVSDFQNKLKNDSIFSEYFKSIENDLSLDEFSDNIYKIFIESKLELIPKFDFLNNSDSEIMDEYSMEGRFSVNNKDIDEEYLRRRYMWKFPNKEGFDKTYDKLINEIENGANISVYDYFKDYQPTQPITMESYIASGNWGIILPNDFVFEDMDWKNNPEIFKYICFNENTFSKTSPENLPEGYSPQKVFDNGKSIGLGIDDVHAAGYTGKGISYALIDSGTLDDNGQQHDNIHFKNYQVAESAQNIEWVNDMHGRAVSYIAQEIAPNADCYYYAQQNGADMDTPVLENLKSILEKNKTLPDDKKIRFVSMSMPLFGGKEAKQVVKELEKQGVWVYYSGCKENRKFHGYLGKIDPNASLDDFNNYQIDDPWNCLLILPNGKKKVGNRKHALFVNSGDRTVPDPSSPTAFRHDSKASQSWSIPVIAGYYVLACQADPTMTKERFLKLAEKTAQIKQSTMPIYQIRKSAEPIPIGRTEETVEIKIIDIKALLEAIENEKISK